MLQEKCEFCKEVKEVEYRPDPYADDLFDDSTKRLICPSCWTERYYGT